VTATTSAKLRPKESKLPRGWILMSDGSWLRALGDVVATAYRADEEGRWYSWTLYFDKKHRDRRWRWRKGRVRYGLRGAGTWVRTAVESQIDYPTMRDAAMACLRELNRLNILAQPVHCEGN
jgi:hypothetical protein